MDLPTPQNAMDTNSTPFIFNLPNELLRDIASWLRAGHYFWYQTPDGERKRAIQILVVMSISQRFRMAALEVEFWTSEDFDFDSLLPEGVYPNTPSRAAQTWYATMNRLNALLKNDRIASRLGAKTRWTFSNPTLLDFAILNIPNFRHTVREIKLPVRGIAKLYLCSRITKLTLSEIDRRIRLVQIHESCPFLEELNIDYIDNHSGTLNDLSSLQTLNIFYNGNTPVGTGLIPLRSTSTLTHFTLTGNNATLTPEAMQVLSTFPNLTHLELDTLNNDTCDFMAALSSKLTFFACSYCHWENNSLPTVIRMFCSESLSRLTHLQFFISFDHSNENAPQQPRFAMSQYNYEVLDTITTALPCIEECFAGIIVEENWCPMFARWRNLEELGLRNCFSILEGGGDEEVERLNRLNLYLQDCIRRVFDSWEDAPLISVTSTL